MVAPVEKLVYRAAIIGAGPTGVAAIGQLLEQSIAPILWIDPAFGGGRLDRYREVPSNTKTSLFTVFGEGSSAFGGPGNDSVKPLSHLDPQKGCQLAYASDLVRSLSERVRTGPLAAAGKVRDLRGIVTRLEKVGGKWRLTVDPTSGAIDPEGAFCGAAPSGAPLQHLDAEIVILATGAKSKTLHNGPHVRYGNGAEEVPLDMSLTPSQLAKIVRPTDTVAVVGSSHSAVLAVKNFVELPPESRPKKIVNFFRSPLLYAEFRNDEHGSWILRDNTGLKGVAADWARENLEHPETVPGLVRVNLREGGSEDEVYAREVPAINKIVYAVGFERNRLPDLVIEGTPLDGSAVSHDKTTGQLKGPTGPIEGLFGYGIAFPELWTDPLGNREESVGMFKFLRYLRRVVPEVVAKQAAAKQAA